MAHEQEPSTRWARALAAWALPDEVLAQAEASPWAHPVERFVTRTRHVLAEPGGASQERAVEALVEPGSVLDVGAGAGAASLPLADRATGLTAVDADAAMLEALAEQAQALGVAVTAIEGWWPDVASAVAVHDVVVAHHVVYNIADIAPFLTALTEHARRRVVLELPPRHPLSWMNPLWEQFWDLPRPTSPTADDLVAVVRSLDVSDLVVDRWTRPDPDDASPEERAVVVARRLCLPASRVAEVQRALAGMDPEPHRDVVTVSWSGTGEPSVPPGAGEGS